MESKKGIGEMKGERKTRKEGREKARSRKTKRSTFSWIFAFAGIRKKDYVLSVVLAVLSVILGLMPYFLMAEVITDLYHGETTYGLYIRKVLFMLVFWCASSACHALSTALSHQAAFYVLGSMRKKTCDKLAALPLWEVEKRSSGALKNTIVERIDSMETTLAHILPEFTSNLLSPVLIFFYLLYVDWRMALVCLVTLPVGIICMMGMTKDYDLNNQKCIDATKALNETSVEYIRGIEVIRVFGRTESFYEKFSRAAHYAADTYVTWMKSVNGYFSMAMSVMPATLLGVLPLGGFLVRQGSLSPENFIMCIILSLGLIGPVITVMSYTDDLSALKTVVGEVTDILTLPEQIRPKHSGEKPDGSTVTLGNVHFGYEEKEVLRGVDISFREGEVTALVGPSGSGKTTIARLIAGFCDPDEGEVSLGGVDIRKLSTRDFESRIAFVTQNPYLFNDSIRENIRMGRPGASDAEVEAAAKAAGCHDFIMGLEHGYDTPAGNGGTHLSGGERQRIAIARAMLKDAPVVILDEATAYMDPENEALVEKSILALVRGKTLIVIAHRLSTIRNADHIVVVEGGRVKEEGTHDELLKKKGLYCRMWNAHLPAEEGGR